VLDRLELVRMDGGASEVAELAPAPARAGEALQVADVRVDRLRRTWEAGRDRGVDDPRARPVEPRLESARLRAQVGLPEGDAVDPRMRRDLEGGLDACIPTGCDSCLYIYLPISDDDQELPNVVRMRAVAQLCAALIREGHRVLSHCGMGFNRSALMAGLILVELGMSGQQAVSRLRERREGALYNDNFAAFLQTR